MHLTHKAERRLAMSEIWVVEYRLSSSEKWDADYGCGLFCDELSALSALSIESNIWKHCDFRVAKYTRTEPQE